MSFHASICKYDPCFLVEDAEVHDLITKALPNENYKLRLVVKASNHPDDKDLYAVLVSKAAEFITWTARIDTRENGRKVASLFYGHYDMKFKEALASLNDKITDFNIPREDV